MLARRGGLDPRLPGRFKIVCACRASVLPRGTRGRATGADPVPGQGGDGLVPPRCQMSPGRGYDGWRHTGHRASDDHLADRGDATPL